MDSYGKDKESICPRKKKFQYMKLCFCIMKLCIMNIINIKYMRRKGARKSKKVTETNIFSVFFFYSASAATSLRSTTKTTTRNESYKTAKGN